LTNFVHNLLTSKETTLIVITRPESNHSSQVPPPRQCYSSGGVTIFALPAVSLMPPLTQW